MMRRANGASTWDDARAGVPHEKREHSRRRKKLKHPCSNHLWGLINWGKRPSEKWGRLKYRTFQPVRNPFLGNSYIE
jgi:hypothetical protein